MSSSGVFVLQGMVLPKFVQSVFETVYCWCTDHLLSQTVPDRCNPLSKKVSRSSDKKLLRVSSTIPTCCNNIWIGMEWSYKNCGQALGNCTGLWDVAHAARLHR